MAEINNRSAGALLIGGLVGRAAGEKRAHVDAAIAAKREEQAAAVPKQVEGGVFDQDGPARWGMAEEPFCPSAKRSSASRTSVRCRCRISVASRSTEEATTASVAKNMAWRSRGITCVETGSMANSIFSAT